MKVTIRKILNSDQTAITDLFNECFEKNILYHDFNISKNSDIIIAEINEEIVGVLEIDFVFNVIQNIKFAIINNVCVKEKYRKIGIGELLIKNAEEICKNEKCSYINLTSNKSRTSAHALYQKENYKIIDTCLLKKDLN